VERRFGADVTSIAPASGGWQITLADGTLAADRVVVATGGLSVPATGSTGFGFDVARAAGHTVHPTYPALTPLTASPHPYADLAGISLDVSIHARSAREEARSTGGFLVTHRGYSGPAVRHHAAASIGVQPTRTMARGRPCSSTRAASP
jgi:predicted flavoprotein YhiN